MLKNYHLYLIGTYGTVFKAKNRETLEIVALKRVRLDDDDEVLFLMAINYISYKIIYFFPGCSFISFTGNLFIEGVKT